MLTNETLVNSMVLNKILWSVSRFEGRNTKNVKKPQNILPPPLVILCLFMEKVKKKGGGLHSELRFFADFRVPGLKS